MAPVLTSLYTYELVAYASTDAYPFKESTVCTGDYRKCATGRAMAPNGLLALGVAIWAVSCAGVVWAKGKGQNRPRSSHHRMPPPGTLGEMNRGATFCAGKPVANAGVHNLESCRNLCLASKSCKFYSFWHMGWHTDIGTDISQRKTQPQGHANMCRTSATCDAMVTRPMPNYDDVSTFSRSLEKLPASCLAGAGGTCPFNTPYLSAPKGQPCASHNGYFSTGSLGHGHNRTGFIFAAFWLSRRNSSRAKELDKMLGSWKHNVCGTHLRVFYGVDGKVESSMGKALKREGLRLDWLKGSDGKEHVRSIMGKLRSHTGCFLTHYRAWRRIANEPVGWYLVLEDDVMMADVRKVIETFHVEDPGGSMRKLVNLNCRWEAKDGSEAYIMSPAMAKDILARLASDSNTVRVPSDKFLFGMQINVPNQMLDVAHGDEFPWEAACAITLSWKHYKQYKSAEASDANDWYYEDDAPTASAGKSPISIASGGPARQAALAPHVQGPPRPR